MKKYLVNVNGTDYEVAVELVDGGAVPSVSSGSEQVKSPMPGTIVSVNVTVGQTVKKGNVLVVLETMKMENEISAPKDGIVTSVNVQKGSAVESGAVLCVIG